MSTDQTTGGLQKGSSILALFLSTGVLLCCALPVALATLAGGAALAALVSAAPWLVALSQHKAWIFLGAGLMIGFSAILIFRPGGKVACSLTGGEGCATAGRFARIAFWISAAIYLIGAFFAYGLVAVLRLIYG